MKSVVFANAVVELGWIAATVFLVTTDHNGWAVATFIGALAGGYTYHSKKGNAK